MYIGMEDLGDEDNLRRAQGIILGHSDVQFKLPPCVLMAAAAAAAAATTTTTTTKTTKTAAAAAAAAIAAATKSDAFTSVLEFWLNYLRRAFLGAQ